MRSGYYGRYVLPVIKLLLVKDQKIEHKELNFGAMCIMESMADMLERKAYGRSKLGEYPQYDICEKLWAYFFKDNHDNELLFRLCEYALMGENPGQDFYCAISAMREMGSIDKEFIDNFFENSFNIHYGKRYKEWHEQMMSFSNEIIKKDNIYMKRLHQYILNSYEKIYEIRKNNPLYFTKIYMHESLIIKQLLLGLLKESEACPLIIDKNNEIWTATQYDEEKSLGMQVFAAIYALYDLFCYTSDGSCQMKEICEANSMSIRGEHCDRNPLKSKKMEPLCPLGQFLYMWQAIPEQII